MTEQLPLRIVVVDPPPGVPWAVQLGRDALMPARQVGTDFVAEFTLFLGPPRAGSDDAPSLRGPAAQGPAGARFVYMTSGKRAGDAESPWDRRAKVPLGGITAADIAACRAVPGGVLEARMAGTDRRGGPACATVPVLEGGWRVTSGPPGA